MQKVHFIHYNKKWTSVFFLILFLVFNFSFITNSYAADSLSYSGRLVQTNGAPVAGPVNLLVELSYTNAPSVILCSQSFTGVALSNGVFHLKLDLVCTPGPTLADVLTAIPANESAAIRVTDVTHSKVYSFQAMHSMPFANIAGTSKQLVQMGATTGQVLQWNGTAWAPASAGGGGTVTGVSVTAPLTNTGTAAVPLIGMPAATSSVNGYLSSADWNTFNSKQGTITAGTTAQYYRGDKSWQTLDTSAVPENINLYFTNARALGVPLAGFDITLTGQISATDTVLQALGRAQNQINSLTTGGSNYLLKNSTDSITGVVNVGTIGALNLNYTPTNLTDATNKSYVDNQVSTSAALKINKAGDTMSGALTLNSNLNINPSGTLAGNTGEVRFYELAANGSNFVALKAADAITSDVTLTLPTTTGTSGQVLTTSGATGLLTWSNVATTGTALTGDIGGTIGANTIGAGKVTATHIAANTITLNKLSATGTASATTYLRGDNTWSALQADVQALLLSTYTLGTNAAISTSDSIVSAFGKLQKQISDLAVSAVSGDLSGNLPNPTVAKIQGTAVSAVAPTSGHFLKYNGTNWLGSMVSVGDLKSTALGNLFPGTGCAANQTLYYSVVGDAFSCANIDTLDAGKITTGTIAAARLPASATYWSAATGGINYAGGNLGIGTTSPADSLDVNGTIRASGNSGTMQIYNTSSILSNINATTGADLAIGSGGSDRLHITSGGNVGIGTTNPQAKLDVSGEIRINDTSLSCTASTAGAQRFSSSSKRMQYCDGSNWIDVGPPAGEVSTFGLSSCPGGWLKANGAAVSRTTYAALFAAVGTTFGAGDGSTTFNLPELRGEFIRGLDDGRGIDAGRALASSQISTQVLIDDDAAQVVGAIDYTNNNLTTLGYEAAQVASVSLHYNNGTSGNVPTAGFSRSIRPRNVALLYCIRY